MSTAASGPWADVDDVRQHLHLDGWDSNGITDEQIDFFISERANLVVEEDLLDTDQSERRLRAIEALLAGHYILASGIEEIRQGARDGSADGAYTWYSGEFGPGLMSTSLGQQAVEMDRSGTLREIAEGTDDGAPYEAWTEAVPSRDRTHRYP